MLELAQYQVSYRTGFLPDGPLKPLSAPSLAEYERAADELPLLISSGNLLERVRSLPPFQLQDLQSEQEWKRAYSLLAFLVNGYLWRSGPHPQERIPAKLAVPFLATAKHHDLLPTIVYANTALWNWTIKSTSPLAGEREKEADWTDLEQLRTLCSFTGTVDEEWFYLASVCTEAAGIRPFQVVLDAIAAVEGGDGARAAALLEALPDLLENLGVVLDRVWEKCRPEIFYHVLRPFLSGPKGHEKTGLPRGVFFEADERGEHGEWLHHAGGSAAQSSLFAFFDVALGVKHHKTDKIDTQKALNEIRAYMPGRHRRFLEHVERVTNIREFCLRPDTDPSATEAYNAALRALTGFRNRHIRIAQRYIIRESRRKLGDPDVDVQEQDGGDAENAGPGAPGSGWEGRDLPGTGGTVLFDASAAQGTGGTPLMHFLGQNRDETQATSVVRC